MDRVTKAILEEFVHANTLEALPEENQFEHLCGSVITSSHYADSIQSGEIAVGAGGDCGIDCISILVNGRLITDVEEVIEIAEVASHLDVTFLFVQAERSPSFQMMKIGQFGFGVQDFFSETPGLIRNEHIARVVEISNEIFQRSGRFQKGNPQCFLYYATTGRWTDDRNLVVRRDSVVEDIKNLNLFRKVEFECIGANKIHELYRQMNNALRTVIVFQSRITLPDLAGVEQAYLGLLPALEFLKLVENENEEIINSVFYDNVRDWQEWNPVNLGMRETIEDEEKRNYFPLLNNGVTIVARSLIPTGNRMVVEDYQIVNGCQTSYVLHETRDKLTDKILIPVRIVGTTDPSTRNSIATATNRQTSVTDDQLFGLSEFPKNVELHFKTYEGAKAIYLERRSKQYSADPNIQRIRIVDLRTLIKAFASIFLQLPHRTSRNYKALRASVGKDIFGKDHRYEPYYAAGYAHFRLEQLFRTQEIASELKPARHHILLAFRLLAVKAKVPETNSREMERYSTRLLEVLWDEEKSKELFQQAANTINEVAAGNLDRDNIRTEKFTEAVISRLRPKGK